MIHEDALRALVAAVGDPVVSMDLSGRVTGWNGAAAELWGFAPEEAIGAVLPHVPKERRTTHLVDLRRAAAGPVLVEETTERKDGTKVRGTLTLLPVSDEENAVCEVLAVLAGVSADSRVEVVLGEQAELIASEFRRHVTALLGYGELLGREEIQKDRSKRARIVRALETRGELMAAVVEDLSVLERFQTGTLRPVLAPADLPGLVADAVAMVERLLPGCRFAVEYDPRLPCVEGDVQLLRRALEKVLTQAADACPESGRIEVSVAREGAQAVVRVATPADPDAGTRPTRAPEVGLAILWRIAEAHGGSVATRMIPSGGTETVLRLPVDASGTRGTA